VVFAELLLGRWELSIFNLFFLFVSIMNIFVFLSYFTFIFSFTVDFYISVDYFLYIYFLFEFSKK
jgi:hypothetical protein